MHRSVHTVAKDLSALLMLLAGLVLSPDAAWARATCKQVSSCEAAVALWCNGYSGADRDNDGIPCENVCHSVAQVEEIKSRQGC